MMTTMILRDRFFYPSLTGIMDSFSCSPLFFLFENKLPEVPEYAKMQFHMMTSLKHNNELDNNVREFQYNQCMKPSHDSMC